MAVYQPQLNDRKPQTIAPAAPTATQTLPAPAATAPVAGTTPAQAYADLGLTGPAGTGTMGLLGSLTDEAAAMAGGPFNERDIYRRKLREFQTETNATNRLFATQMATLQQDKNAIVGRARAAEAAGIGGYGGIVSAQRQAQRPIDTAAAAQEAKVAEIMNRGRTAAAAEVEAKRTARRQGYNDYITFLKEADTRKATYADEVAQAAIDQDADITEIDLDTLARQYGIPAETIRASYFKKKRELEKEEREQLLTETEADLIYDEATGTYKRDPRKQAFEEAEAELEYDPATGTYKSTATKEGFELGEGQQRYEWNADTGEYELVASGPEKVEKAPGDFAEYEYGIANGYINPDTSFQDYQESGGGDAALTADQKKRTDQLDAVISQLQNYRALYDAYTDRGGSRITGPQAAELRTAKAALEFAIAQASGTGALQAPDRAVVEEILPNPTGLTSSLGQAFRGGKEGGLKAIDRAISIFEGTRSSIGSGSGSTSTLSPSERQQLIEEGYDPDDGSFSSVGKTSASTSKSPGSPLAAAFSLIKREEGLRTTAYQDQTGKWTIGFGNTMINGRPVRQGDKISTSQALKLMQDSVVKNYTNFAKIVRRPIAPNKFAALTSFEYNLGPGVWNDTSGRQILSLVKSGRFAEAGRLMLPYNKSRDPSTGQLKVNPVLAKRRQREANLLLS